MKKILFAIGLAGGLLAGVENANAAARIAGITGAGASDIATFTVDITLTPKCVIDTIGALAINYTPVSKTAATYATGTTTIAGKCTGGVTVAADVNVDDASDNSVTDQFTGLVYKLLFPGDVVSYASVPVTSNDFSFTLTGKIKEDQFGTCGGASSKTVGVTTCTNTTSTNKTRTVTLSY